MEGGGESRGSAGCWLNYNVLLLSRTVPANASLGRHHPGGTAMATPGSCTQKIPGSSAPCVLSRAANAEKATRTAV